MSRDELEGPPGPLTRLQLASQIMAKVAAFIAVCLWVLFLFQGPGLAAGNFTGRLFVAAIMMAVAALAWRAAEELRPGRLAVAFVLSFLPVGLYLLGTPSPYLLIGVCDLTFLLAAILMRMGQPPALEPDTTWVN